MRHESKNESEDWLDQMLDDVARIPVPDAPPELMARVLADAEHLLPQPGGVPVQMPLWRQVVGGLGGWGALGGLAVAGVTGLAIGLGAFDAAGIDALWSIAPLDEYDSQASLTAFGWDYEEG
ncbi:hypothetical protein [Tateyamaria pelophila]|uniref:hypothetical protein n=1 Tax=Tateyamaria pelophila TaxID=328415 RepID=UPI001CBDD716|nr:hypothetical protein [Tateyamaria pelophila]